MRAQSTLGTHSRNAPGALAQLKAIEPFRAVPAGVGAVPLDLVRRVSLRDVGAAEEWQGVPRLLAGPGLRERARAVALLLALARAAERVPGLVGRVGVAHQVLCARVATVAAGRLAKAAVHLQPRERVDLVVHEDIGVVTAHGVVGAVAGVLLRQRVADVEEDVALREQQGTERSQGGR